MGKKAKEFQSGDFIFAKVKGYPAWPARVQSYNGKKYFVYFYGTGETANLPPNMIFDYAENKAKFLTKAVKRRDFNEGAKQIELDFANNTPLDQILVPAVNAAAADGADDSAIDESMDVTADTTADDTVADTTATTQNDTAVEDSDDPGALVIDEGKTPKGRKSAAKTPAKEAKEPKEPAKTPKTPRGKPKKEETKKDEAKKEEAKKDEEKVKEEGEPKEDEKVEEIVSRSGRKIRPKRYIDEQTEENTTLPSPASKKRRAASTGKEEKKEAVQKPDKTSKSDFNNVALSELEDLKEPFKSADPEKENILMAYLPTGTYVGIKLFQSCPTSFKNDAAKLQWDKQAASNAITLKMQLERGQISPQSIIAQLVTDLNLTDEEKAALDKERETEEKKSRVNFLKSEMKLIELDAKIKSCLCLEKADTELCLKLLDELAELNVRPLMLLKHPTCLETVKRMRAYVGNTPSWDLSESEALLFSKQAHRIRKQADALYSNMKALFAPPAELSFWEFFSERVLHFKRSTAALSADELLEMVHEPLEMTQPTSHTMRSAIEAANIEEPMDKEEKADAVLEDTPTPSTDKKKAANKKEKAQKKETPKKAQKKETPQKKDTPQKESTPKETTTEKEDEKTEEPNHKEAEKESEIEEANSKEVAPEEEASQEDAVNKETPAKKNNKKGAAAKSKKATPSKPALKRQSSRKQANDTQEPEPKPDETEPKDAEPSAAETSEETKQDEGTPVTNGDGKEVEDVAAPTKAADNNAGGDTAEEKPKGKEKEKEDEPRAKRSRAENKKTDVTPSPARTRKSKV